VGKKIEGKYIKTQASGEDIEDGAMIQIMGLNYFDIYSVQSFFTFFHIIAYFISFGYFIY
jgi:hypothetical protein